MGAALRGSGAADQAPEREVDVIRRAAALLEERLPANWSMKVITDATAGDRKVDALVELESPGGTAVIVVEAKARPVVTSTLPMVVEQLREAARRVGPAATPLLVGRYLSPSARSWLENHKIGYADATGNLRIEVDRPALFIRDVGADRDPWRGRGRPRGTLKGLPAARVVRALADYAPPVAIREIVETSGASTGATYRAAEFLEDEGLIERSPRGPITAVRWRPMLERWSQDYGFQSTNVVRGYLEPRGMPKFLETLRSHPDLRYALTGSLAAHRLAPYAPPRAAMLYVDDLDDAVDQLGLRVADSGANVLLAVGGYNVVFDRLVEVDGIRYAAPSQVVVDLLTGPGRNPSEGQALLDWMERHESEWRSRPSGGGTGSAP